MTDATIETYSGRLFDILEPQEDQFDIYDIAHSLSQTCRFTGHTKFFYSVAQHSWLGSYLCLGAELEFLLHDASEAFICDMSRPLKHFTDLGRLYQPIEKNIMKVVRKKFGLPEIESGIIHKIDSQMLYAEKAQLLNNTKWPRKWGNETPADVIIEEYGPRTVELLFLDRFEYLTEQQKQKEL